MHGGHVAQDHNAWYEGRSQEGKVGPGLSQALPLQLVPPWKLMRKAGALSQRELSFETT